MSKLTIIAKIIAKEGKSEDVKKELLNLIGPSSKDAGFINYDVHQDNDNKNEFLIYENWESMKLWQKHMETDHLKEWGEKAPSIVAEWTLNKMTHIK